MKRYLILFPMLLALALVPAYRPAVAQSDGYEERYDVDGDGVITMADFRASSDYYFSNIEKRKPTATPVPTDTPEPTATATDTATPTATDTPEPTATPTSTPVVDVQPSFPIHGIFYYGWFPEAWNQRGLDPYTRYTPVAGRYDSGNAAIIKQHIDQMQYGNMDAGIASWWGQGTPTDRRIPALLRGADGTDFRWSLYYEKEGTTDPTAAAIAADLDVIATRYGNDPNYLRVNGKPVLFVYGGPTDNCATAQRWRDANSDGRFYTVLKVFSGYLACAAQPSDWHQYSPAVYTDTQGPRSYSISPGFHEAGQPQRLARNAAQWQTSVRSLFAANTRWRLVQTWNEWGEGTSVEAATEWASPSGYGYYLDVLHNRGQVPQATPVGSTATPLTPTATPRPVTGTSATLIGAGDISWCENDGDTQTAAILARYPDATIATFGDNVYQSGTPAEFANCFGPTWGRFKDRIRPSVGNHEYLAASAAGYYNYFGTAGRGVDGRGWYSYGLGDWHIVVLNSECSKAGGCGVGSAQYNWLQADLAANPSFCTLAYDHHPRWSSGDHGSLPQTQALYQLLYDAGTEVLLSGHDHAYERFAPKNPSNQVDPQGIRQFVVGTGGKNLIGQARNEVGSEVRNAQTFGVLKLDLQSTGYAFQFLPVAGKTFTDSGVGTCH